MAHLVPFVLLYIDDSPIADPWQNKLSPFNARPNGHESDLSVSGSKHVDHFAESLLKRTNTQQASEIRSLKRKFGREKRENEELRKKLKAKEEEIDAGKEMQGKGEPDLFTPITPAPPLAAGHPNPAINVPPHLAQCICKLPVFAAKVNQYESPNYGKFFVACSKSRLDDTRCKFFRFLR